MPSSSHVLLLGMNIWIFTFQASLFKKPPELRPLCAFFNIFRSLSDLIQFRALNTIYKPTRTHFSRLYIYCLNLKALDSSIRYPVTRFIFIPGSVRSISKGTCPEYFAFRIFPSHLFSHSVQAVFPLLARVETRVIPDECPDDCLTSSSSSWLHLLKVHPEPSRFHQHLSSVKPLYLLLAPPESPPCEHSDPSLVCANAVPRMCHVTLFCPPVIAHPLEENHRRGVFCC